MKQITLIFRLCFVAALILSSCKKDKNTNQQPADETPLKTAIDKKNPADTIYQQNASSANFGFKFRPFTSGMIIKLGCRMPTAGTYTVSLWDFISHSQLAQVQVTVNNVSDFTYASISAVSITANTNYVISVNSSSSGSPKPYYQLYKKPTTAVNIYPFTSGNFVIEAPLYKSGSANAFPDYNNGSDFPFMRGVADFVFVKLM